MRTDNVKATAIVEARLEYRAAEDAIQALRNICKKKFVGIIMVKEKEKQDEKQDTKDYRVIFLEYLTDI